MIATLATRPVEPADYGTARPVGAARRDESLLFFLVPSFSMIAFTNAVEPLRIANRLAGRPLYSWRLVSKDGGPVTASNGISVNVDAAMRDCEPGSAAAGRGRAVRRDRHRALPGPRGVRLAAAPRPARGRDRGALHRRARAGARRPAGRPPLHHPLGEPAGPLGGVPRHRGDRGPVRERRQALHLLGRDRRPRPDAAPDRARGTARSWRPGSRSSASSTASAVRTTASACRCRCGSASTTRS